MTARGGAAGPGGRERLAAMSERVYVCVYVYVCMYVCMYVCVIEVATQVVNPPMRKE